MFQTIKNTSSLVAVTVFTASLTGVAYAGNNELTIEQVGHANMGAVYQGNTPSPSEASQASDINLTEKFKIYDASEIVEDNLELGDEDKEINSTEQDFGLDTGGSATSLKDILEDLPEDSGVSYNEASLIQDGNENRALMVQLGGTESNMNIMATKQFGHGNIGVHIQTGAGNNTILQQGKKGESLGGNKNALIAKGGVHGPYRGPVKLKATNGVKGFSLRMSGQQPYGKMTVTPNKKGGLNITAKRQCYSC